MANFNKISFHVQSDLSHLEKVLGQFETLNQEWVNPKDWLQCQLALAEGFTNAVRHAHKKLPPDTSIEIEIIVSKVAITIKIWDYGEKFDLNLGEKSLAQQNRNYSTGGRGIAILKKIADYLSYDRCDDHRNCLIIHKKI